MNRTIFKFFALILLLGVFLGVIGPAPTAVKALTSSFDFPPGPTAIPDPGAGLSCQNSITRTVNVPTSFIIADLNVGLNISHARRSDVRVTLTPPTGPVVVLISGAGLGSPTIASPDDFDNYDVMLDDASLNSLFDNDDDNTGGALYERNAKPYGLLSSFKGLDAQGIWTLSICDTRNGTAGNYLNGRLVFTSADPDTITGTVFTDFNDNGLRNPGDLPVSGVTVTAFDASGAVVDSDVTNAAGGYTLNILNGTQVRIEFTAIPANLRPGAFGRDSGTTVQFVTSPGAGVDLGLTNPFEYCQNNPFLVMPCYINGDPLAGGAAGTWDTLVSIPNDAFGRTDANIEKTLATGAQIGTTWGLAYQRTTNNVFAGALTKRHSGMGPLGAGGIYRVVINPATGASVSVSNFVDISQPPLSIPIIASGTYPPNSGPGGRGLVANSNTPNTDPLAWDLVGKSSIGDMDIGTNDDVIWLVNLANQTLYSLPVGIPAVAPTTYNAYPITLPAGATACPTADVRPWAVEIYRNEVYVGVVCSAESSQNVNALRAYILKISEAAPPPGSFQLVFEFPLNYPRGIVSEDTPGYPAEWRPWSPVMTSLCRGSVPDPCNAITDLAYDKQIIYPQPILSDIEFDTNGDLILGFMDRLGHQAGNANYATSNPWANPPGGTVILYDMNNGYAQSNATFVANAVFEGVSAGDVLRACRTGGGGFILENNATCGSLTTGGIASAPAQGPGGGEYYWQDMYPASTDKDSGTHNEVLLGGLVLFPGTGEVAVSMFDPFDIRSGGVTWLNNTTGNRNRAYEVFPADSGGGATTFGKAAGIGDLEGFCYSAPIEIGNRVWVDTNGNGIQEPGEAPLANVTVELLDSNGVVISTVTTDASGNYFFSSGPGTDSGNQDYLISGLLPNSNYTVRIPDISGGSQQAALVGMSLTQANQGQDLHDSDATVNGVNAVISVTTGNPGGNNHTYDFGFQPAYSLGNRVWLDDGTGGGVADNGVQDGTEVGIGNVVVNLYADTNNDGTPDGGIIGTQTTDANGYYRFDNLLPGYYIVEIAASNFTGPLTGLASSSVDEASPNSDVDRNDNGLGIIPDAVNGIRSGTVQLGPGTTEPQNETDLSPTGQGAADDRANMTVDFGFVPSYSLGNRVWFDTNNNNLIDFGTEVGIDGVWVELYQDNGDNVFGPGDTFVTGQSTTSGGYYRFDNLPAGDYIVVIPDDNFRDVPGDTVPGNPLAGYWSSGTGIDAAGVVSDSTANDADTTATDSDENGRSTITGNRVDYVASAAVTLGPGTTEPLNETDLSATGQGAADGRANMTVDFGFYRQEVGDVVFVDLNNSGIFDGVPTDALLSGAQVQLYSSNGTEINVGPDGILGTSDDASGGVVTGLSGTYQFSGLPAGDYIIRVTPPVGYSSTVDSAAPSDTANPDINSNSNDNGIGIGTGQVSSGTLTMTPGQGTGGSAGKPNNVVTQGVGRTVDNTVDFGFVTPFYSLGNRVWLDDGTGGGVADNGVQDGTEVGIGNVVVNLYADTNNDGTPDGGIIGTQTTDANGYYRFDNLLPGYYIVEIAASNFTGPLTGLASSSVDEASPNSDVDRNDNGLGIIPDAVNGIRSGTVQLGPGTTEPQNETDLSPTGQGAADDRANMTVDFGFVPSYSLGNRVWFDTNNNNLIDFGTEVGIDGVWVELYQDNGDNVFGPGDTFVTGQSTTSGGYYRFDNLPAGDYIVVIPDDNFRDVPGDTVPGNPLAGYWSSGTGIDAAGVVSDSTANDADTTATDSDENGRSTITGNRVDYVASAAVTLGPGTTEPLNETDLSATGQGAADGRANMTVDFGFYRQEVGDVVFVDLNNSGIFDGVPTDALLSGAQVQLYSSNGTEINVGPDGILGTSDDASGGVVTGLSGTYQFSGLPAGDYIIRVTPPVGYSSTVDSAAPSDTANPDINSNSNDNGIGIGTGQVSSGTLTMTPGQGTGGSAGKPNNVVTQGVGRTVDNTVDFGFVITGVFTKTIVGTNETFTTDPNVAVGEIVTYEIVYNLPLGTALNNVTITDRMDKGLAYVDCLQVLVAGADQTAAVCPTAIVSSITNPGDSAANPANPGRQVVFNLGNIPAQAAAATIRVRYRAIVLDVIENVQGVSLNNDVTIDHSGGSFSTSAPDVIIVEPDLVIEKTAVPSVNVAVGTPITFTLTINHSPLSQTDAFDVEVTDILPPELEYIPCTIAYSGFAPTSPTLPTAFCPGATNTLAFRWDVLPLGATSTITFNARLVAPTAENAANVAWTSLPIDLAPNGQPVQLSVHNSRSTERWFDPLDNVNIYGRSRRFRINPVASGDPPEDSIDLPERLPETGFAPGVQTIVPAQPVDLAYRATDIWLEIPRLGLKIPIVGVPLAQDDWDLTWLWNEAGWLEGTAFPSWSGNSVLTGHVTLPNGQEGPFAEIGKLKWGDRVIIHAYGATFEYEVRQNRTVSPLNSDVLEHEEEPWLTLITCKTFNESSGEYTSRIAIRAVLVGVEAGKTSNSGRNIR